MKKIKGYIATKKVGSACNFELEVDDSATEKEIEEMAQDAAFNNIEWSYTVDESSE